jgi:hypothetical protein
MPTRMTDSGPGWFGASTFSDVGTMTCSDWSVSNSGASGVGLNYNSIPPTSSTSVCGMGRRLLCLGQ